jgi:GntR family transcriptional repressor for pyruvate dehydrogenase complex
VWGVQRIERRNVVDAVVEQLQELVAGMSAGQRLPSERELMATLGVGRGSVREAMRTLTLMGLLEVRRGEGTFVRQPDAGFLVKVFEMNLRFGPEKINEFVEVRQLIEGEAASLAATRRSEGDVAELRHTLKAMRAAVDDPKEAARWDVEFHMRIARATGNLIFAYIAEGIHGIIGKWVDTAFSRRELDLPRIIDEHEAVVEAIAAGDGAKAREVMSYHLSKAAARLTASMAEADKGTVANVG